MDKFGVPGVVVGVHHGDASEVAGFGVTSAANPLPVDADTFFQIGSISKTFTATAAMRLVEKGVLDLDEPVRTYLPGFRMADEVVTRALTMRHLLSHTGGFAGDYFNVVGRGDDALARMVAVLDGLEQLTPLGEVWSYNNAGFYIAGRAIEVITDKPFEDALGELVLDPLELQRSYFFADDVMTQRFAVGHDRVGAVLQPWSIGRPGAAIGGLISTAPDLLRYARLQWNPGGFLSEASIAEMRRPHSDIGGLPGDAVGLGWYRFERNERVFLRHSGATNGQVSQLVVEPNQRFALAILTNHDDGRALVNELQAAVLRVQLGVATPADELISLAEGELREYTGAYESQSQVVTLALSGGALVLHEIDKGGFPEPDSPPRPGPPPTRLAFTSRDAVVALDTPLEGTRAEFLRDTDGDIAWFRYGGRLHRPLGAAAGGG